MATINVYKLNDGVVDRLKRRVTLNNQFLESEALYILECAVNNDFEV